MQAIASTVVRSASPPGFQLVFRPGGGRRGIACWLALPTEIDPLAPPLVAVHGIRRGALDQAELFAPRAATRGRVVIAPIFEVNDWPRYQQVVRKGRADLALLALMSDLRIAGVWRTPTFELTGFSGGAQFAHRFAMLHPLTVSRLSVAAAGWYTFPDSAAFPYGLGQCPGGAQDWGPRMADSLDRFAALPIDVCVGARDNVADANTRSGARIERQQGADRLTRARRWAVAMHHAALTRGITPRIALRVLPGCGHNFCASVRRGGLDRFVLPAPDSRGSGVTG